MADSVLSNPIYEPNLQQGCVRLKGLKLYNRYTGKTYNSSNLETNTNCGALTVFTTNFIGGTLGLSDLDITKMLGNIRLYFPSGGNQVIFSYYSQGITYKMKGRKLKN